MARPSASQRSELGGALPAIGGVEQLARLGRVVALAAQERGDLVAERRVVVREAGLFGEDASMRSSLTSHSQTVCLPAWSIPSTAMSLPASCFTSLLPLLARQRGGD